MTNHKHFRIQDLPRMLSSELDDDDLFLMTNANADGSKQSKSLNFGTLANVIGNRLNKNIADNLQITLSTAIYDQVSSTVDEQIDSTVNDVLSNNITKYAPIQKWYDDGKASDVEGFVIECGNSGSDLEPEDLEQLK